MIIQLSLERQFIFTAMSDELDNCFSLGKSLKIVFYTTTLQNTIKLPVEKYIHVYC